MSIGVSASLNYVSLSETPIDTCKNLKYWEGELGLGRVEWSCQREALAQGPRPSEARPCEAPKAPRSPCLTQIKQLFTRCFKSVESL